MPLSYKLVREHGALRPTDDPYAADGFATSFTFLWEEEEEEEEERLFAIGRPAVASSGAYLLTPLVIIRQGGGGLPSVSIFFKSNFHLPQYRVPTPLGAARQRLGLPLKIFD